jgi:hypothetical protein
MARHGQMSGQELLSGSVWQAMHCLTAFAVLPMFQDPKHVDDVLDKGAAAAAETANATLNLVKDAMGFVVPARVY